ncbi:MAG: cell envelope integrity protein TolA [Lysobacter sp.]
MRETRADTAQAFGLALLLHVVLFVALFAGLWWTRNAAPSSAAGSMSAELVDASSLSTAMQRTLRNRPEPVVEPQPQPEPEPPLPEPVPQEEPVPPQPKPQDFIPEPDTESQEAVVEQQTPIKATETTPQEAKRQQEQVDLTELERQQDAERKKRLSQMELERLKQLDDIRKRRAAAAREAELAEQKLEQIANARAGRATEDAARADAGAPGNNGDDTGLKARYAAALTAAIQAKWTRPDTIPIDAVCRLIIRQLPGGEVMNVEVSSPCAYDEQGRRSIEAAVLKAQPLPYQGFESVFQRTLILNFRAGDL